jgi:hypothetical protein
MSKLGSKWQYGRKWESKGAEMGDERVMRYVPVTTGRGGNPLGRNQADMSAKKQITPVFIRKGNVI